MHYAGIFCAVIVSFLADVAVHLPDFGNVVSDPYLVVVVEPVRVDIVAVEVPPVLSPWRKSYLIGFRASVIGSDLSGDLR